MSTLAIPDHPVPFVRDHGFDMDPDYMAQDQRFIANRADVLTYQTAPLTEDLSVIGPILPAARRFVERHGLRLGR